MASPNSRRNKVSPTTVILVLVLLGAVAGASRLVTPPPPLPKSDVKAETTATSKDQMQKMHSEQMAKQTMMQEKMKEHAMGANSKIPSVPDPHQMEVTNDYFRTHKPGEAGFKQVDQELAQKTLDYNAYLRKKSAGDLDSGTTTKTTAPPTSAK